MFKLEGTAKVRSGRKISSPKPDRCIKLAGQMPKVLQMMSATDHTVDYSAFAGRNPMIGLRAQFVNTL